MNPPWCVSPGGFSFLAQSVPSHSRSVPAPEVTPRAFNARRRRRMRAEDTASLLLAPIRVNAARGERFLGGTACHPGMLHQKADNVVIGDLFAGPEPVHEV